MKIKYINENYFKTPEEAREAMAKAHNADKASSLSNLANKVLEEQISELITSVIQLDEVKDEWYNGTVFNSEIFGRLSNAMNLFGDTVNGGLIIRADAHIENDEVLVDVYIDENDPGRLIHRIKEQAAMGMIYTTYLLNRTTFKGVNTQDLIGNPAVEKEYIAKYIKEAIEANKDKQHEVARRFVLTKKMKFNKIHMFSNVDANIIFQCNDPKKNLVNDAVERTFNGLFSFDNSGDLFVFNRIHGADYSFSYGPGSMNKYIPPKTIVKLYKFVNGEFVEVPTIKGGLRWDK